MKQTELKMMDILRNKLKGSLYVLEQNDLEHGINYYCGSDSINGCNFVDYMFDFDVNVYIGYDTAMKALKELNREDVHIRAL